MSSWGSRSGVSEPAIAEVDVVLPVVPVDPPAPPTPEPPTEPPVGLDTEGEAPMPGWSPTAWRRPKS
jgi:hypothetical protein